MKKKRKVSNVLFIVGFLALLVATLVLFLMIYRNEHIIDRAVMKDITQYPLFWIIIIALVIWLISLLWYITLGIRLKRAGKRLETESKATLQAISAFADSIDNKSDFTKGHSKRVAEYSVLLGKKLSLKESELKELRYVALLHDVGMSEVPDTVLNKPGPLLDEEKEIVRLHTTAGGRLLSEFDSIAGMKDGALYHHERYDGKGYPEGLKGNKIPLYARIIAVADAYDAMTSRRPYRNRLSKEEILSEFTENLGKQFDSEIGQYMIDMLKDGSAEKAVQSKS